MTSKEQQGRGRFTMYTNDMGKEEKAEPANFGLNIIPLMMARDAAGQESCVGTIQVMSCAEVPRTDFTGCRISIGVARERMHAAEINPGRGEIWQARVERVPEAEGLAKALHETFKEAFIRTEVAWEDLPEATRLAWVATAERAIAEMA